MHASLPAQALKRIRMLFSHVPRTSYLASDETGATLLTLLACPDGTSEQVFRLFEAS